MSNEDENPTEGPRGAREPLPRRVEWSGPEGWLIWADEDGVHIRTPKGDGLEYPSVIALIDTWSRARRLVQGDSIPAPRPPTREQLRGMDPWGREEHLRRRVLRAVESELNPTDTAPPF